MSPVVMSSSPYLLFMLASFCSRVNLPSVLQKYKGKKKQTLNITFQTGPHLFCLHASTLPGRVLPHSVVDKVVVQEREVVVEGDGPAAGLGWCVFGRELPVVGEVGKDLVVVVLELPARSRTVPEYHFLARAVAQTHICNVEVDLSERAALSSPGSSSDLLPRLPSSGSFVALPAGTLPFSPLPSPVAGFACGWGGVGGGGGGGGGVSYSANCNFDEINHIFILAQRSLLHGT